MPVTMSPLLHFYLDICLFRKGPQDAPGSRQLLLLVVLANMLAGVAVLSVDTTSVTALQMVAVDTLVMLAFLALVLALRGYRNRFVQTLNALAGVGTLMSLFALPLAFWYHGAQAAGNNAELAAWLLLILLFWNLSVISHILRHALSWPLPGSILLATTYVILSMSVMAMLFPDV